MGAEEEEYPGSVREYGLGVAYQRFLWKDAYTAVHALPLLKDAAMRTTNTSRTVSGSFSR